MTILHRFLFFKHEISKISKKKSIKKLLKITKTQKRLQLKIKQKHYFKILIKSILKYRFTPCINLRQTINKRQA